MKKNSLSGIIKIPNKLLNVVTDAAVVKMLSYAYESTDNYEHWDIAQLIKKYCDSNNITLLSGLDVFQPTTVAVSNLLTGLPKSYYNFSKPVDYLTIALDNIKEKSNAYFSNNKLYICTSPLRSILYAKRGVFLRNIEDYVTDLKGTIQHELTHFMQHNFLHEYNGGKRLRYDSRRDDFNFDDYFASQVEFDPHIKDAIYKFMSYLKRRYGFPDCDQYALPIVEDAIATYVGAIDKKNEKYDYNLGANDFFVSLKHTRPKAWKRAAKIFAFEVTKRIPTKFRKYWHLDW